MDRGRCKTRRSWNESCACFPPRHSETCLVATCQRTQGDVVTISACKTGGEVRRGSRPILCRNHLRRARIWTSTDATGATPCRGVEIRGLRMAGYGPENSAPPQKVAPATPTCLPKTKLFEAGVSPATPLFRSTGRGRCEMGRVAWMTKVDPTGMARHDGSAPEPSSAQKGRLVPETLPKG